MSAPQWDGVPQNPERDGYHWLEAVDGNQPTGHIAAMLWFAGQGFYASQAVPVTQRNIVTQWRYLAPCHTPAEVAALVDAARREGAAMEREACAALCDMWSAENFRLCTDTILTYPLLRGDPSRAAVDKSKTLQLEGAGHAYAAHAAKNIAAAIRARGEKESG